MKRVTEKVEKKKKEKKEENEKVRKDEVNQSRQMLGIAKTNSNSPPSELCLALPLKERIDCEG